MNHNVPALSMSQRLRNTFDKHRLAIAKALLGGDYRQTPEGLLVLKDSIQVIGTHFHRILNPNREMRDFAIDDGSLAVDHNLLPDEGILYALALLLYQTGTYGGGQAQLAHWYIALFNGSTAPSSTTTAANFASTLTEITSTTEGYTNSTRPEYVGSAPASGVANNLASMASFTIATATSIDIKGSGVLSSNVRGGTAGKCLSAAQYGATRTTYNAEVFQVGYQLGLSN